MTRPWLALAAPAAVFLFLAEACASSSSTPPADAGIDAEAGADAPSDDAAPLREDEDEIPCAPRRALKEVCQQCHARSPQRGAPFSLVRRSDFLVDRAGMPIREAALQEVQAGRMPLAPVTIADGPRNDLLDWLRAGAPAVSPTTCDETDGGVDADAGTDADAAADAPAD